MWANKVAARLRASRRAQKLGQDHVASALEMSVSEVSRLERGVRGLRVEQVEPWAHSLGCKVQVVMWETEDPEAPWDEENLQVLAEVAAALPHLPSPARAALVEQMRIWRKSTV